MKVIDRYIFKQILYSIIAVVLVILGLDILISFLDQLKRVNDSYTLQGALNYSLWTSPRRVYENLTLSTLVGVMVGLGVMASQNELTVMRAAGISTLSILRVVYKPVMLVAFFGLLLGEYVAPYSEHKAQTDRDIALSGTGGYSQRGLWHKEGNTFIYIDIILDREHLRSISRHEFDENQNLVQTSHAHNAFFEEGQWRLTDIKYTIFDAKNTQVKRIRQEYWQSSLTPDLISIVAVEPTDLSISGLWSYSQYLRQQSINADNYLLAFWAKILQPLSISVLVLAGISFIFGPLRSVPVGQRIISGVILGFTFKIFQDLLGPASSVYGFPAFLAILVPIVLCGFGGWYLLKKAG